MKSIKSRFSGLGSLALLYTYATTTTVFGADAGGLILDTDVPSRVGLNTGSQGDFRSLLLTFVDFFLGFLGLLAVLMVIYGGFLYMTAAGEETKTETGKKVILYAVIGIAIILISFALVNTVISQIANP